MISILHIIWGLELGGKERVLDQLVRGLDREQFSSSVWALRRKGRFYDRLLEDGFAVHYRRKNPGIDPGIIRRLRRELRLHPPDLIHVQDFTSTLTAFGALVGRETPPVIATEHLSYTYLSPLKKKIYELLLGRAAVVTAVSVSLQKTLMRKLGSSVPVLCIPNGIDLGRYGHRVNRGEKLQALGLSPAGPVAVMVGRLEDNKNYELLLRAARLVCRELPECRFLVAGGGRREGKLKALAGRLHLEENVFFLGPRDDVPEIVSLADVCVHSSRREGYPLAVIEYLAAGKPVVATRVGGLGEIISDGETGLLVDPDDEQALAGGLISLLRNPAAAAALGRNAAARARALYSVRRMVRAYEELYREILARARTS